NIFLSTDKYVPSLYEKMMTILNDNNFNMEIFKIEGVYVAGGAVFKAFLKTIDQTFVETEENSKAFRARMPYFNHSDIDVFITASNEEEYKLKLREIINILGQDEDFKYMYLKVT